MIVEFACIHDYEERREGAYARNELNIFEQTPLPRGGSFGTEQAQNAEAYRVLSTPSYSDTRDSSVAVPHIQRLIPRKEGAPRNDYTMNGLSYCPATINFACLLWSPTASEALSYAPRPPWNAMHYIRAQKLRAQKLRALRAPHSRTKNHSMYAMSPQGYECSVHIMPV